MKDSPDTLLWSHSNFVGHISAAIGYDCIFEDFIAGDHLPVFYSLWKLNIPTKLVCFSWLLGNGKILTWDHLQSRGYSGPSWCVHCECNYEDVMHLFLHCPFSMQIFSYFSARYGFSLPPFSSVLSFLTLWLHNISISAPFRYIPLFIFWFIWISRNNCIFENLKLVASVLISRVESYIFLFPVSKNVKKCRQIGSKPNHVFPCGYFDGAAMVKAGGAGFVIYLSETHYYCFSLGCGSSSNTRAELLALWAVLRVSNLMGLPLHSIYGDSKVIISWINDLSALDLPTLIH